MLHNSVIKPVRIAHPNLYSLLSQQLQLRVFAKCVVDFLTFAEVDKMCG